MKANETQLRALLEGQKQFRIPLFQRTYSWTKENWAALWDDIVETHNEGTDSRHFLGSIVSKSLPGTPEGISPYLVIDGQQRLITLTILLAALAESARPSLPDLARKVADLYLKNVWASGLEGYKVLPTQADRHDYFAVIDHGVEDHSESRIWHAYEYFCDRMQHVENGEQQLDLKRIEQVIVSGLEVVSITLGDDDNEYRIFESLNATGVALTQADLIRNYIFMRVPNSEQDQVYAQLWLPMQAALEDDLDDFFRYAWLARGEFVREADVYQVWKKRLHALDYQGLIEQLRVLAADSNLYLRLIHPDRESDPAVSQALKRLNRWRGQTIYSFLLNVYRRYEAGALNAKDLASILLMLESFLVRRFFARVPPNALNRLFLRLYDQLPKDVGLVEGTRIALSDPGRRWPRDVEFSEGIRTFAMYLNGLPDQRRIVLETLESSYGHKEGPDLSTLTIEHVMPQTLTPEWRAALGPDALSLHEKYVHTLGNLTLTAYNPNLSNSAFENKRKLLKESNLQMNKEIAQEAKWNLAQIDARAKRLTARALALWPGPVA